MIPVQDHLQIPHQNRIHQRVQVRTLIKKENVQNIVTIILIIISIINMIRVLKSIQERRGKNMKKVINKTVNRL